MINKKNCFLPFVLILLAVFQLNAQTKRVITHEDLQLMKRVGSPAISPDGKWVVYNLTETSYDEKENINDLWIVPSDGSKATRRLTSGKGGEGGYSWSPDGAYLAFTAKRDGDEESQIYILNLKEGGDAQRVTNLSTGASGPKWSPDGKKIMFNSSVFPLCYADSLNKKQIEEKKKIKYKARVYESFPIRNWDRWLDEKQTHAFVLTLWTDSAPKNIFTDVKISQKAGFGFSGACWSADSKEIIFSASTDVNTTAYQESSSHLYKVSVEGGDATQLTSDKFDYYQPAVSQDGKYILCFSNPNNPYKVYSLNKLVRLDYNNPQNKLWLTKELDRPVNNYVIGKEKLYLSIEDQGNDKLVSLPINGGAAKNITNNSVGCYNNLSVAIGNESVMVSNYESSIMPSEIVKINQDGKIQFLTNHNEKKLQELDLKPIEVFWHTSSRGKKIRNLITKPAEFDSNKKYPLFVMMHGGPAGSFKDTWGYRWNYHLLAGKEMVIVMTDYTGSTGYGEKFAQDIQNDPFKGPGEEILEGAKEAIKKFPFIDSTRQAAGGASYGGHLANWMQATTSHFKCLISHAGAVNFVSQWGTSDVIWNREVMYGGAPWTNTEIWKSQNPYLYISNFKTPMLITIGEQDFRVPLNNSIESWHIHQRLKIPSKLIVFPEENHWILKAENSRFFYKEVNDWLLKYLK